ncbi:MAG: type I-MYXAN CRISPR-associated protein Cas5/Cmx5/DevS [Candidatus Omnitrophica bacterium]|nr:type I-MYXAN CRISPR-associated protein Cas5/Cmx5/DevS [Candidatus Omnitrophota bacterium]
MIGVYVTVPIACFRKGLAREYLETEIIPPPSTCYGFLLSLVGETNRERHIGVRVTPMLLNEHPRRDPHDTDHTSVGGRDDQMLMKYPEISVVLRTVWRVKKKPLGSSGNTRPDYQQILSNIELILWLDSSEEENGGCFLEQRVRDALDPQKRQSIKRFGGLSLGESTHLVDCVSLLNDELKRTLASKKVCLYQLNDQGLLGLPVWVDHVGSAGTVHVVGDLIDMEGIAPPELDKMPKIASSYTLE